MQSGFEPVQIPHRKPKGGKLSTHQKQENRTLSQSRVVCENAFAGAKHYNAMSVSYRNRKVEF
ncbi:transposase family protein [Leptolyngbya sp. FACHB-541]|uniref:transposase family protein n=1 Tax=Leptolyngbya sp. FACHB-541 TaxID=2692810 RepID=UPI0032203001